MKKFIPALTVALLFAPLVACTVEQTEEGRLPDVDVEVEGGNLPEYDVDVADVDVDLEEKTLEVPDVDVDVDVEKKKVDVKVPDVDVHMPNEKEDDDA